MFFTSLGPDRRWCPSAALCFERVIDPGRSKVQKGSASSEQAAVHWYLCVTVLVLVVDPFPFDRSWNGCDLPFVPCRNGEEVAAWAFCIETEAWFLGVN